MPNQNPAGEAIYDARALGVPKMMVLGFQHVFAMFGATVLVPLITGLSVSTTLLMAGLGTLLFHIITRGKVPAFLGSSFAFLGGFAIVAPKLADANGELTVPNAEMLPYACGGVVAAGLLYVIVAGLIHRFGVNRVMRFFPPVVTGPIIISIGLILAPSAISNASTDWFLAIAALAIIIICNIWGRGMVKIIPILLGVLGSYALALVTNKVDFGPIAQAQLLGSPIHMEAMARFDLGAILTIMPIALAAMMEHIGDMAAISATVGQNFIASPGLARTLLGDGLATSLAGFFGGPANPTYGANTGVLALTRVYDPKVIRIAAVFAIVLGLFGKVGGIITSIPGPVTGGISIVLYGMISSVGVRILINSRLNFGNSRNLMIAALIFVLGIGCDSIPVAGTVTISGLALAAVVGMILAAILPVGKDDVIEE